MCVFESRITDAMKILRSLAIASLATGFNVAAAIGDEWISPDGVIAVDLPNADLFQQIDDPPKPLIAFWISKNPTFSLGVTRIPLPSHIKLSRSSLEEGFIEEVGGTITDSSSVVKNGNQIRLMTAKGLNQGTNFQITQAIVHIGENVYKVMASHVGNDAFDETVVNSFIESIDIRAADVVADSDHIGRIARSENDQIDVNYLSRKIGGAALILLIGTIIWLTIRRSKSPHRM